LHLKLSHFEGEVNDAINKNMNQHQVNHAPKTHFTIEFAKFGEIFVKLQGWSIYP
jgi:predicted transposase YbfD/YdcC